MACWACWPSHQGPECHHRDNSAAYQRRALHTGSTGSNEGDIPNAAACVVVGEELRTNERNEEERGRCCTMSQSFLLNCWALG